VWPLRRSAVSVGLGDAEAVKDRVLLGHDLLEGVVAEAGVVAAVAVVIEGSLGLSSRTRK
jgi:hypothetical protein